MKLLLGIVLVVDYFIICVLNIAEVCAVRCFALNIGGVALGSCVLVKLFGYCVETLCELFAGVLYSVCVAALESFLEDFKLLCDRSLFFGCYLVTQLVEALLCLVYKSFAVVADIDSLFLFLVLFGLSCGLFYSLVDLFLGKTA